AWQEIGEKRVPVTVAFRVSDGEVGFSVGRYDHSYPLIIDPTYLWNTFYGSGIDDAKGITIDGSGNVYVTGDSYGTWGSPLNAHSGSYCNLFVLKLNSSGAYQWHTFYGGAQSSIFSDHAYGIAVDSSGNVYVTGGSGRTWGSPLNDHSGTDYNIFVLKLNSSGIYQWHTFYGAGSSPGAVAFGIAVDNSGNVYVTGQGYETWGSPLNAYSGSGYNIFVLKLNSSGAYQWHTFYGGFSPANGIGIALDGNGNIYATGLSWGNWGSPLNAYSGDTTNFFILKLDSSGAYQWHTFHGSRNDAVNGIAIDSNSNIYVTGYHVHSGVSGYETFVLKLNSSGAYQWYSYYGSNDHPFSIAVDSTNNIYVAGYSWDWGSPLHAFSGSDNADIFVLKLNSSGVYQWHTFYGSVYT
ncbi:MAG: SBBP repeat-containing protein, partial [Actinobacteria bacterium]|nr:SBBP repeat-containing protein [Actinomycetota bacterium]